MVKASDIKVILPCLFADTKPIWMMTTSCYFNNIEAHPFGVGQTYAGWVDIKVTKLKEEARKAQAEGYSHVLYSDARDAWFCGGLEAIAAKYNILGEPPILLSAQRRSFCGGYHEFYDMIKWDTSKLFPYIGTPGQLCSAKALEEALQWMEDNLDREKMPDDDPPWWICYMKEHPSAVTLDHGCSIFMNVGDMNDGEWEIFQGYPHNLLTNTWPSVLHFNGGSSDAMKGKWESLEQHWIKCGYRERPPWEAK